jgi:hypothetical protein
MVVADIGSRPPFGLDGSHADVEPCWGGLVSRANGEGVTSETRERGSTGGDSSTLSGIALDQRSGAGRAMAQGSSVATSVHFQIVGCCGRW